MKSLHKAFDILEYVFLRRGSCVTPSEASQALGIHLVTCTRIMGELVKRGYLVQVSRKSGYVPGPMVPSLCTRSNPYVRLAEAARTPIAVLSRQLGVQVNLAVLNAERRIMLTFHLGHNQQIPWDHFFFTDHWDTATGRLLLAAATLSEDSSGVLQDLSSQQRSLLDDIARDGHVRFPLDNLIIIGHWIRLPGYPVAAFGFGVPPARAAEAFQSSAETARLIETALTPAIPAY